MSPWVLDSAPSDLSKLLKNTTETVKNPNKIVDLRGLVMTS